MKKCSRCSCKIVKGENEYFVVNITLVPTRYDFKSVKDVQYAFCSYCYSKNFEDSSIRRGNWL